MIDLLSGKDTRGLSLNRIRGLLEYLKKKQRDERMFQRWVAGPQFEIGFEEFKRSFEPVVVRDDDEVLDELEQIYKKAGVE